jgi:hypothetical protein
MNSLDLSPRTVVEALRGNRERRPCADTTSAAGLRSLLEDGLYDVMKTATLEIPLVLRASSLRPESSKFASVTSPLSQIRGILVTHVLRFLSVGAVLEFPFEEALRAWRLEDPSNQLVDFVDQLEANDRARLATDVTAHAVTLSRSFGHLHSTWMIRTACRATQFLCAGQIILRDSIDLMIGTTVGDVASIVLFDVTSSPLGQGVERTMRYHALVQTLRTGVVPLRTSSFSTATGEMWTLDVDHELLVRCVHEVLEVVNRREALTVAA